MNKVKIVVDANALAWKAKHCLKDLSTDELKVGVIFGFMNQILKIATDYNTNDISFCWDSRTSKRQNIFPAYKERRRTQKEDKTPEEIEEDKLAYQQFTQLYAEILPLLGVTNNYKIDGYEGDDCIASIVYSNPDNDLIIASGDEDMFQLLVGGVSILRTRVNKRGKREYYLFTEEMFKEEYGIESYQWVDVKAIAGCKSDEVPGIKGVGEASAIDFLKGNLTPNNKRYQSIICPEGKAIRKRNLELVSLPLKGCPDIVLKPQGSWSFEGFIQICNQLDFRSMLSKETLAKWKISLNLK